jgi:hypothetical protein
MVRFTPNLAVGDKNAQLTISYSGRRVLLATQKIQVAAACLP